MRRLNLLFRKCFCMVVLLSCTLVTIALAREKSDDRSNNITAVSGIVTGNVQEVGFRAMIQKQAIQYNLAGSAENTDDQSVRFVLQGFSNRIKKALKKIRKGTKNSSDVLVRVSPVPIDPDLSTFTIVNWTSKSRGILHPYNLVFDLRPDNTTIKKREVKEVWLQICEKAVTGEDAGKCIKDDY